ncbi:MAG: sulfatase-like hydrolase/transferase [Solobacterium sp.]|nr:sulfatase-like hydrolase/transferase [Solobacterium sp.]
MEQKKRRLILETVYFVLNLVYFLYIMSTYGSWTSMDAEIFVVFALIGAFLFFLSGPLLNRLILFLYGGVFTLYMITQSIYHRAFHTYYRFNTAIDLLSEVRGAASSAAEFVSMEEIITVGVFAGLTLLSFILYFALERGGEKKRSGRYWRVTGGLLAAALVLIGHLHLRVNALSKEAGAGDLFADEYIYRAIPSSKLFVERFGLLTYGVRDAQSLLIAEDEFSHDWIEEFLAERDDQFISRYHGLFAGKNVIFIQAESFNHVMLDPDLTPTLYKMYKEGLVIENFNTPALPGSTSDTEFMANVSLIPSNDGHASCYRFGENIYKTTLPGLFNDHNYKTAAYHNNYGEYYNRDITMYTFGYQQFLDCTDLGMMDTPPDSAVMEVMKYIYSEETKPWMAYWITYSGHQPYDYESTGVSSQDVARIRRKYPNLSEPYVSFYAKNMDLDKSIKALMDELRTVKKLDNTVFVFFGDHIVKNLDFSRTSPFYRESGKQYTGKESYTDLYFYCSAMQKTIRYPKCATALDLIPTVADLWGWDIDMHTVLGRNIFDPDYTGFYFSEWDDWATDNYSYKMDMNEFTFKKRYDINAAKQEILYFIEEKEISRQILVSDYFADGHSTRHEYTDEELEEQEKW